MENPFSLHNKNILVTGSSSGIGRDIAKGCAAMGGEIVLTGRNEGRLKETQELLEKGMHQILPADLGIDKDLENLVEQCPVLDGIVLNAGMVKTMPLKFLKASNVEELFTLNIKSNILLINKILKQKKIKRGGSICFISSIASEKSTVGNSVYSATKGAVNSFTKAIALELAPMKIRANAVRPGFVHTSLLEEGSISTQQLESHKKNYPLGRFGKPDDVTNLVIFLLSDASQWMTGSLINIDGGFSLK